MTKPILLGEELWNAIKRYAVTISGEPSSHVYDNTARMEAIAAVGDAVGQIVGKLVAQQQIDNLVVAARACALTSEIERLRAVLMDIRGYFRSLASRPELAHRKIALTDEVDAITKEVDAITKVLEVWHES